MKYLNTHGRLPPKWRDPEFPDIDLRREPSGAWVMLSHFNRLQEQRGLPPIGGGTPSPDRPLMTLSWWDRKQRRQREIVICADIVMRPALWNRLHPAARRLVPRHLLPQAILDIQPTAHTASACADGSRPAP